MWAVKILLKSHHNHVVFKRSLDSLRRRLLSDHQIKMKEDCFKSLCSSENLLYCSKKQRKDSEKKTSKPSIPLTTPTYVHLYVESASHSAAVQICISPFSVEDYPNQIFFSSKYRYCPCCTGGLQGIGEEVRNAVQHAYSLVQVGRWDFSHSNK